MGGEHHRLPDRALVALGVAEQRRTRAASSRWRRAASAAPAASERPWPSEPVEKSIPGTPGSGCVPSRVPSSQYVESSSCDQPAAEVERRVEGEARVALREDEAVAIGVARVVRPRGRPRRAPRRCRRRRAPSRCGRRSRASTARGRYGGSPARTRGRPSSSSRGGDSPGSGRSTVVTGASRVGERRTRTGRALQTRSSNRFARASIGSRQEEVAEPGVALWDRAWRMPGLGWRMNMVSVSDG